MYFVGHTIRALAIWAMIPLNLLRSTPIMGCVCANGQHKFLCQRRNAETSDSATTVCSCCHPDSRHASGKSSSHSCCARRARSLAGESGPAVSTRCCQSVLEIPSPSVVGEKVVANDDQACPVHIARAVDDVFPVLAQNTFQVGSKGDLPPPDFVILHQVFLI